MLYGKPIIRAKPAALLSELRPLEEIAVQIKSDVTRSMLAAGLVLVTLGGMVAPTQSAEAVTTGVVAPPINGVRVSGNKLIDSSGATIALHGVDRAGSEYMCTGGGALTFDGPADQAAISVIKSWGANAVRVPLNEDCWLGINGEPASMSSATYRSAIAGFVSLLAQSGLAVILDLHWSAPGSQQSTGQVAMPDADHAPAFWTSVAQTFANNSNVIFDAYNEPYPDSNQDTTAAWTCLRDGGSCPGVSYQAAGMQSLVNTIRATGATNVIMVPGVQYSNTLTHWLQYMPTDPLKSMTASWHSYAGQVCSSQTCWDANIAPVTAAVPLVTGEIGENDCAHSYVDTLMTWLDAHGSSYLAWAWDTYNCSSFPSLISAYDGTPTNFGIGVMNHLQQLVSQSPTPTPTATQVRTSTPTATRTSTPVATATPTTSIATATPCPSNGNSRKTHCR